MKIAVNRLKMHAIKLLIITLKKIEIVKIYRILFLFLTEYSK